MGIQNNVKFRDSASVSWPCRNKVKPKFSTSPFLMVSSLAFLFKLNKPCRLPDSGLPAIQCGSSVLDFAMDPFNRQQLAAGEYRSEDLGHFGCLLFRWANQLLHGLGIIGKQNSGLVNFIPEYYCVYH